MEFLSKLQAAVNKNNSLLSVGLDPNMGMLPAEFKNDPAPFFAFGKSIVDATADLVCAFKPNSAFYEARGADGIAELKQTCDYIRENYPEIPIILDFKRGDIDTTNSHYTTYAFDYLQVDAVTIQPYEGKSAFQPFLDRKDKGIIVLCRMSNESSREFQDMMVDGRKLYEHVAEHVRDDWNENGNCLLVVGATSPEEMAEIRQIVGDDMWFLVPGVGAQGGSIEATLRAGGEHLIVNSARDIIYNENPRQRATEVRDEINKYRNA
jgi:orotidine-5'-phosphate decarboxylase